MVLDEGHHTRRIRIEIVVDERVVEAIQTVPPSICLFVLRLVQFVEEREVHHGLQIGILLSKFRVLLPSRGISRLRHPSLTYGIEVGIFLIDLFHPLGHRIGISIGIGVHADAIDTNGLDPPDAVLNQVAHQMGIVLVQIRHRRHEPSLYRFLHVYFRGIGIHHGGKFVARLQIFTSLTSITSLTSFIRETCYGVATTLLLVEPLRHVQPVFRWHVLCPWVLKTTVVEDHVHHDLQSFRMGLVAESLIILVRSESWIHLIIISGGIAVIGRKAVLLIRRVVLQHRRKPECRHTQFLEVVQVLTNTVQVTTMP